AGSTVVVRVTATNSAGSATAVSAPVAVLSTAPASVDLPTIRGDAVEGSTVTADAGTWNGSPTGYTYQWRRCASSSSCADIAGATGQTYTLGAADVASTLFVVVTAT